MRCFLLVFIGFSFSVSAQWKDISLDEFSKAILSVEARIPENVSYSYSANYAFFNELQSKDTVSSFPFKLIYQHQKGLLYLEQYGRKTIQNETVQLVCDTANKQLIINNRNPELFKRKSSEDYQLLLKSKCTARKRKHENQTIYLLTFAKGARYKEAEIWIENDGMVTKYILYAGVDVPESQFETNKFIHPRMEITYSKYIFGKKVDDKKFDTVATYLVDQTNLKATAKYQSYEIIDLRKQKK